MSNTPLHARLEAAAGNRTYRHLGELTGVHAETVRRYMQGQPPSVEFVTAFCTALAISVDWLLSGQGPMLAGEVRGHVLKTSAPTDLLGAMGEQLESMRSRIERVEMCVQILETRVGASLVGTGTDGAMRELKTPGQGHDGQPTADSQAEWIADAVTQRPPASAG